MATIAATDYRARYYDPNTGRFLSEDPAGFGGGANFYAYVGNSPVGFIDPNGLARTPAECQELLRQIKAMSIGLGKELAKYDPVADGAGGWPMKWGSGVTKPGGHYTEMSNYAAGIANRAAVYWKECKKCDGNPSLPQWIWDSVKLFNRAPKPVIVPMVQPPPIPDELINWYDPSPLERFNNFMNHHFGHAPSQGTGTQFVPPPINFWQFGPA
ncbi:MAG: RHS repeat-associated core domain-containing protein [Acidobacteriaceae bacterium]